MRGDTHIGRLAITLAIGAALAAPMGGRSQAATPDQASAQPFRVCADPDNLPFSSAASGTPGLYVEMGQALAKTLGRPFAAVWSISYFGQRTVRGTLLAGKCDAYVGLPEQGFMQQSLVFSKPFLHVGYALMLPPGLRVTRLGDLAGKRVAVQFSTPPHLELADHENVKTVTFLNPDDAAKALVRHEVDAAFIWGPTAGYINATTLNGAYQVIPIAGEGMQWPAVIGFAKTSTALRDEVNRAIDTDAAGLASLAQKYGLPTAAPITLANNDDQTALPVQVAASTAGPEPDASTQAALVKPVEPGSEPAKAPPAATDEASKVAAGRDVFNGTCSHCHGPDAVQSERRINLRLLHHRYGDKFDEVFNQTVTHGRPDKGMPNWSGVFTDEDFSNILAFLHTVQAND